MSQKTELEHFEDWISQPHPLRELDNILRCSLCGEPMPPGEEMFKYHGYSGDCPKPSLAQAPSVDTRDAELTHLRSALSSAQAEIERLRENISGIEFSSLGYCPACSGWEVERGRGCKQKVHTKTCWIAAAKAARKVTP